MKNRSSITLAAIVLLSLLAVAFVPSLTDFNVLHFDTTGNKVSIRTSAFTTNSFFGVTNALGYFPATNGVTLGFQAATNSNAGITNALGYIPATNNYGGITNSLGFAPATNGVGTALGYQPATNSLAGITNALGYIPMTNSAAAVTNALGYIPATNGVVPLAALTNNDTRALTFTNNSGYPATLKGTNDGDYELVLWNTSTTTNATTSFYAVADNGYPGVTGSNYNNVGINGSMYKQSAIYFGQTNDAYGFVAGSLDGKTMANGGGNYWFGTYNTNANLYFSVGNKGTLALCGVNSNGFMGGAPGLTNLSSSAVSNALTYLMVSNTLGYQPMTNGAVSLGYQPATNTFVGISNALTFGPATNTLAGITNALGYIPGTNNPAGITLTTNSATWPSAAPIGGAAQIVNSNSTPYLLLSSPFSTAWTSTNSLNPMNAVFSPYTITPANGSNFLVDPANGNYQFINCTTNSYIAAAAGLTNFLTAVRVDIWTGTNGNGQNTVTWASTNIFNGAVAGFVLYSNAMNSFMFDKPYHQTNNVWKITQLQ
jgi:hypothetical protein